MKTTYVLGMALGCFAAAIGLVGESPGSSRRLDVDEMSAIVGGAPALGNDRCKNACNATNGACENSPVQPVCYVAGGYITPGDRCAGGGGGQGFVYACMNVTPWQFKCNLGGPQTNCTPATQCIWTLAAAPVKDCPSGQKGVCAAAAVPVPEQGNSSCTNVPAT